MRIELCRGRFPSHDGAKEMMDAAMQDFVSGVPTHLRMLIRGYAAQHMRRDMMEENEHVAKLTGYSAENVLLANLVYELSGGIGCTSMAYRGLHCRNLDWFFPDDLLRKHTLVVQHRDYATVGWPGLYGAFTGMSARGFSISLNAVVDPDNTQEQMLARASSGHAPGAWVLRRVLETAGSYHAAVKKLLISKIVSPCMFTVCGADGQGMVIRKTASGTDHFIGYGDLPLITNSDIGPGCSRYDTVRSRVAAFEEASGGRRPTFSEAMTFISGEPVCNAITAHQVVMEPATGRIEVVVPESAGRGGASASPTPGLRGRFESVT